MRNQEIIMPRSRIQILRLFLLYATVSCIVAGLWTYYAKTEIAKNEFASITAIAEGRAPTPFVSRRLAVDSARVIAASVPASAWTHITHFIESHGRLHRVLTDRLNWKPRNFPLLIS